MAETDDAEIVEVNQNIPCEIYAIRGGRLAGSPTPRGYLTLTFDAIAYRRLSGLLMANLKGTMMMHVVDIQAPLDDDPDDEQPIQKLTPQIPLPDGEGVDTVTMSVNGVAAPVKTGKRNGSRADGNWPLHAFKVNEETPGLCGVCHHREDDDLHDAAKGVHVFTEGEPGAETCSLCGNALEHELHERTLSPEAQALIEAIDEDEPVLLVNEEPQAVEVQA